MRKSAFKSEGVAVSCMPRASTAGLPLLYENRMSMKGLLLHTRMLAFLLAITFVRNLCAAQQPNILWITIEDTSPHFVGSYGNASARTPVMDRLASEGVRFTSAFSTGTVCSPSRSTLITGVRTYALGTGNHRSAFPVPDFIKGFPHYLQQEGYYVTNNSKTDYNVAGAKDFISEAWHESSPRAGWWNRQPGQPFFSVFNFMDAHQSRTMTHSYEWYEKEVLGQLAEEERIAEDEFTMPPFYNDTPDMRKQVARVYNSLKLTDNKIGRLLERLSRDELMDSTIIFFFADHGEGIPRGKTNGINLGYRVPFVIWFPEMYRHLSPWGTQTVSDELISFEDLPPTLISLAGGEVPAHMKGRVLIGDARAQPPERLFLSSDRSDNGIDMVRSVTNGKYVYSRNYMPFMPEARYIRYMEIGEIKQVMRKDLANDQLNPQQKSLFMPRPAEFLFDVGQDPWELKNLAQDEDHEAQMESFRRTLEQNILDTRDVMFVSEYDLGLIAEITTPYQFRQMPDKYPLKKILNSASLAGFRGKKIAARQASFLTNADKNIRYWAAVGLRSQPPDLLARYRTRLSRAMNDVYPPVAITAAAILYDQFKDAAAATLLKEHCRNVNPHLALMSINYLLYMEDPKDFVKTVEEVKERENLDYSVSAACKDFLGRLGLIPNNFENR